MPRGRLSLLGLGLSVALVTGCSAAQADRSTGDPVTAEEAEVLAGLLHENHVRGGADFVVTAPYSDDALLTLTGSIDFRRSVGRAQAVTSFSDGRAEDTRTLFFTPDALWIGDVPGLDDALAADGAPDATYLRRPLIASPDEEPAEQEPADEAADEAADEKPADEAADEEPADAAGDGGAEQVDGDPTPLVDVLAELLLNLSARTADEPGSFLGGGYTWEGQRSIDSRLASLFGLPEGRTVAVGASDDLLTQFGTPLAGGDVDVTVTLSDHGSRRIDVPAEDETVDADDHPEVAAALGL
jgi:hypothetical protein